MLDPQLGIWHCLDPHSDKYVGSSPYVYGFNNPIIMIDPSGKDNVIYLDLIDGSMSKNRAKRIAKQATQNFRDMGLKTTVKVFKGEKFDVSKMDATDAVAIIGKTKNVYKEVNRMESSDPQLAGGISMKNLMEGNTFGRTENGVVPEVSSGKLITISTEALDKSSKQTNIGIEDLGAITINHGAGHDANLDHAGGYIGNDKIPGNSIMSNGDAIAEAFQNGNNINAQFVSSINNRAPQHVFNNIPGSQTYVNTSPIYRAFINRFGNNESSGSIKTH